MDSITCTCGLRVSAGAPGYVWCPCGRAYVALEGRS